MLKNREKISNRVFELDKWPMFEFKVYNLSDEDKILLIDSDMMIMDGMSTEILIESLHRCYNDPEDIDIVSFDAFEKHRSYNEQHIKRKRDDDESFWKDIIGELPSGPQFEQVQNIRSGAFASCERIIPKLEWDAVKARLSERHILPSVYVMTAYAKVLARWCSQKKITINITVSNRKGNDKEILKAIGDFTEVLLVDFDFSDNKDCIEAAAQAQKKISRYKKHMAFESSAVIREYSERNNLQDRFPFPAVCTSMMFDKAGSKWEWLGERLYQISQTPQVVLDNQVSLKEGALYIHWDYVRDCFSENMINQIQQEYISALLGSDADIQDIYDLQAHKYNETYADIEKTTLTKLFKRSVERYPQHKAVVSMEESVTYSEMDMLSDKVAAYTLDKYGKNKAVVIKMSRSINAVAAMLGIIKTGGYYIPVAEDIPKHRLEFIINRSDAVAVYDDETVREILLTQTKALPVDFAEPDAIAYVIYTSGSTGEPKGVVITHDAVCNTIQDINCRFNVKSEDAIIGISFFGFDLSVYDIFGSLSCGAALYLAASAQDMFDIRKLITENNITVWNTVPSIMELLITNLPDDYVNDTLRVVMLSGDWISLSLPEKIKKHFPNAQVYSLGGATEASIWSIYYPVEDISDEWKSIPYGYPLANQTIWILDDEGRVCPCGVRGEICIGGRGVAKGYLNDKERTSKQFVEHEKLGYIYKTGDIGYLSESGYVVFMGRKDFQVKLNGYRIELGEIESCLLKCNGVREAIAEVKQIADRKMLAAYITPETGNGSYDNTFKTAVQLTRSSAHDLPIISSDRYESIQQAMDDYSLFIMFDVFSQLYSDKSFTIDSFINENRIDEKYRKILTQWADSLVEAGDLSKDHDNAYTFCDKRTYDGADDIEELRYWKAAFDFLSECSREIRSVITEKINPMTLLFKDGKSDIADNLYGQNPVAEYYNDFVAEFVKNYIESAKDGKQVRILEVGAGVGATTEPVLKKISGLNYSYHFTDVSAFFNEITKNKLGDDYSIDYGILDIDETVQTQGYQAGEFDIIIAANVIHDGKNVDTCLKNLRELLCSGGALVILEVTKSRHFHKISMGLMNGYSAYEDDYRVRKNSPLLDSKEWASHLKEAGFNEVCELTDNVDFCGGQSVIAAFADKCAVYPDLDEIKQELSDNIVSYMIPESIIIMDSFPYTSNGKIDRKKTAGIC